MYNKKGQAALEFLMTYGWAILAAIIVIGALGSYFYFNQSTQSTALVNAPFYAEAWSIADDGFELGLQNNGGEDVVVTSITITNTAKTITCTGAGGALTSGATTDFDIKTGVACATSLGVGDSFKGSITVAYTKGDSAIELASSGSISGDVVA